MSASRKIPRSSSGAYLPYLILIAVAFAVYANIYGNEFLLDDEIDIVNNALLRSWHSLGAIFTSSFTAGAGVDAAFYRPLQTLLYLVVYQIFGPAPPPFHFLNVALHALNGCLVYALGRRLGFRPMAVLLAALLWVVHPLFVETIANTSGTAELLYVPFCLGALLILLPDFTLRKYALVTPLYALALLSKETAILFPLLALSCQFLACRQRREVRIYLRAWPLLVVAAGYFLLRHVALGGDYTFYKQPNIYSEHILYRFYTFLATLPAYAELLVWPHCLHMDRIFVIYLDPLHGPVIAGAVMIAAALAQIAWGRARRGLALSWGFLWFAGAHALHSGVLWPLNSIFLEHWMYMPTIGLFLGIAETVARYVEDCVLAARTPPLSPPARGGEPCRAGRLIATLSVLAVVALGAKTLDQNTYWREPIRFYEHAIKCGTIAVRVHNNLGNAYLTHGDIEKGIEQLRIGIAMSDEFPQTHHNLALALLRLPDGKMHIPEAIAELKRAIVLDNNFFESYEMLANIYDYRGEHDQATLYRNTGQALRKKFGIPADEYAQPRLTPYQ